MIGLLHSIYDRPSFIPKEVLDSKTKSTKTFDWSQVLNDKYGLGIGSLKDYIGVDDPAFIGNPSAYTLDQLNDASQRSLKDLTKYDSPVSPVFTNDSYHLNQSRPYVGGKLLNPVLARKAIYKMSPEYIERLAFDYYAQEASNDKTLNTIARDLEKEGYKDGDVFDSKKFRNDPKYREFFAKKYLDLEGVKEKLLFERNQPIEYKAISTPSLDNESVSDKNWDHIYTNVNMFPSKNLFPSTVLPHEHNHYVNSGLGRFLLPDYSQISSDGYSERIKALQRKIDVIAPNRRMLETFHTDYISTPVENSNAYDHVRNDERGRSAYDEGGFINPSSIPIGEKLPLNRFVRTAPDDRIVPAFNNYYLGSSTIGDQDPPSYINTDRYGRLIPDYSGPTDYQFRNYYESTEESMADFEALRDYLFKEYNYDYSNVNSEFTKELYNKLRKDKRIKKDGILKRNFDRIGDEDEDFGKWKILVETLASNPSQYIGMPTTPRNFFPSPKDYRSS